MGNKYLAVVVTPPIFKASGGVAAGIALSNAIAKLVPYEVALMADRTVVEVSPDGLTMRRFECANKLGMVAKYAPQALRTLATRAPALIEHIAKTKPSLVHFHNPHPAPALWEIAQACLRNGIPYVMSAHGFIEFHNPESWLTSKLKQAAFHRLVGKPFKLAVKNAAAILLTSPPEHAVADALHVPLEKRFIVTNGHDIFFQDAASEEDLQDVREKFKLRTDDMPTYFFLGNQTPNKGIDTLLDACHKVKQPCKIVIGGMIRSKEEHASLLQEYRVSELGNRVVFTDFLTKNELRAIYQSVDGFVFPSKADTLPLVILDAMASGLPVISTRVGGIPFQVDDANGLLINPSDSSSLAHALDEFSLSKELRIKKGYAGLQKVKERFCWDNSAKESLRIYNTVINNSQTSS